MLFAVGLGFGLGFGLRAGVRGATPLLSAPSKDGLANLTGRERRENAPAPRSPSCVPQATIWPPESARSATLTSAAAMISWNSLRVGGFTRTR